MRKKDVELPMAEKNMEINGLSEYITVSTFLCHRKNNNGQKQHMKNCAQFCKDVRGTKVFQNAIKS